MEIVYIKFMVDFLNEANYMVNKNSFPYFCRWLPNGENDSIELNLKEENAVLYIWFERFGFKDKTGIIQFDYHRKEVIDQDLYRQSAVESGPLFGLIKLREIEDDIISVYDKNKQGDEKYIKLGKKIVKKIIEPKLRIFHDILYYKFGQYWLGDKISWDSQKKSLGAYCNTLNMKWKIGEKSEWKEFLPNKIERKVNFNVILDEKNLIRNITKKDWCDISRYIDEEYMPSMTERLLIETHELIVNNDYKYAFVQGITALELAVDNFHKKNIKNKIIIENMQSFYNLSLKTKMIAIISQLDKCKEDDIIKIKEAINIRNKIVHEGGSAPENSVFILNKLLQIICILIDRSILKFPERDQIPITMEIDKWEAIERKYDEINTCEE